MNERASGIFEGRRRFLRDAAGTGGALAMAALAPATALAAVPPRAEDGVGDREGYRLTDHVISYYDTLRG